MRKQIDLKRKLLQKELTIGSWLSWGFSPITEIMAKSAFEWLVIDMEHTAIDFNETHQMIQTISLAGCVPLVRVGGNDPLLIKRSLDCGAHGVVVPMVNNAKEARDAVDAAYYPPRGFRGVGLSRAQGYGLDFDSYREKAAEQTVVIVQIEHIKGVENIEEILSVDGVDGFIIGPYDLSGSIGHPGAFDHPDVRRTLDLLEAVLLKSEKPGGIHVVHTHPKELDAVVAQGYRFVAYGDDMVMFAQKVTDESKFVDALLENTS